MSAKAVLLAAIRDELKASLPEVGGRVFVVVEDAEGTQYLPELADCPFTSVADLGLAFTPEASRIADGKYQVRIRAHVRNLRDVEAPVLGDVASGEAGAAELQDTVVDLLQYNVLAARIVGVEQALPVSCPAVTVVGNEHWSAVAGDVIMDYRILEDGA